MSMRLGIIWSPWNLGMSVEVYPSIDSHVQKVKIRFSDKNLGINGKRSGKDTFF